MSRGLTEAQARIISRLQAGWHLWAMPREPEVMHLYAGWLHHARMLHTLPYGGVSPFPGNGVSGVLITRMVEAGLLHLTVGAGGNDRRIVLPDDPLVEIERECELREQQFNAILLSDQPATRSALDLEGRGDGG